MIRTIASNSKRLQGPPLSKRKEELKKIKRKKISCEWIATTMSIHGISVLNVERCLLMLSMKWLTLTEDDINDIGGYYLTAVPKCKAIA
jgi:hypothetical protein